MKEFLKKEYPKALILYKRRAGFEKNPFHVEVVYSKTSYDTFVDHWKSKCGIDERRPKWSELTKHYYLVRLWYMTPNWLAGFIVYLGGLFTKDIIKISEQFLSLIGLT